MITFNLQKKWYEKIRKGEKSIEYREAKPYWSKRFHNMIMAEFGRINNMEVHLPVSASLIMLKNVDHVWFEPKDNISFPCILRLGYTKEHMTATITKIELINGKDTDLAIDRDVYAIHLTDVRGRAE